MATAALSPRPAVVAATLGRNHVDLFARDVADVAGPNGARLRIDPQAPRIADAPDPDVASRSCLGEREWVVFAGVAARRHFGDRRERIVRRHRTVEPNPEDLAVAVRQARREVIGRLV